MTFDSWRALYTSDVQSLWAVCAVPVLFLVYLAVRPAPDSRRAVVPDAARFMRGYAAVFTIETLLDPIVGGPLLRYLGVADSSIATVVIFVFVLLGDFRVFLLIFTLTRHAEPDRIARGAAEAARWTFIVPVVTLVVHTSLRTLGVPLASQAIWLIYELSFLAMAIVLWTKVVPARAAGQPPIAAYLRALTLYVATYYALWAAADVLIMAGSELGWALRMLPNQLYYGLWVPLAYTLFFSRRYASTRTSTQAAR